RHLLLMVERAFLFRMERHHDREDRVAMLDRGDATGRIALAVAQAFDLVDDRDLRIAGQDEIAMDRMRQPALDGAACRHHGLPDHLAAEHPLPARLRAAAPEQVHLELFEIENGNQVDQALGHGGAFVASFRDVRRTDPESRDSTMCNCTLWFDTAYRPGMTAYPCF